MVWALDNAFPEQRLMTFLDVDIPFGALAEG
jgi:hypothetical protein